MARGRQKRWILIAFICFISIVGLQASQFALWWTTEIEKNLIGGEVSLHHHYGLDEYENGSSYFSELRGTTSYEEQTDNPVIDNTIEVSYITIALISLSTLLLIFSLGFSFIIFITKKYKKIGTMLLVLAMLSTLAVPVYYGVALPMAMKEDYNDRVTIDDESDVELQILDNVTPLYTKSFSGEQNENGVKVTLHPLVGWYIAAAAFVFSCISVLLSIFPSKTQNTDNNDQSTQKPKSNGLKRFKKTVAVITIITLVLGGMTCYVIYLPWKYNVISNTGSGELDEIDITLIPEEPNEGELIKLNINVLSQRCRLSFQTFFTDTRVSGGNLDRVKIGLFTTTIGPFANGTEIWGIVRGYGTLNQDFILEEFSIQIGNVVRDDRSSLRIENVLQDPEYPASTDNSVHISAEVNSNANIEKVELVTYYYSSDKYSGCWKTRMELDSRYFTELNLNQREITDSYILYYKIGAKDLTGNTKVTPTINVETNE